MQNVDKERERSLSFGQHGEFTLHIGPGREMGKRQHCKGIWHAKEIRFRSDSILIVVQIQVGSVRATAKVTEWVSLFLQFVLYFK